MMWTTLRDHRTARRITAVDELQFPAGGRHFLANRHPHLSADDIRLVEAATRQWFRLAARRPRATLSMPSVVVDESWQDFARHESDYATFCAAAFGRPLPHRSRPAMTDPRHTAALLATLDHARRDEGGGSPGLPLLFRVDKSLGIDGGNRYLADCGGRGECFELPGHVCLQHLAGPGKRLRVGGIRGDRPGYSGQDYGGGAGDFGGGGFGGGGDFGGGGGDGGGGGQ